jgi:hypothetical protein
VPNHCCHDSPYLSRDIAPSAASGLMCVVAVVAGGACAEGRRWLGRCARAPSLISVHGLVVEAGDMMGDGVIPLRAVRPLGLSRPSSASAWRQEISGSRPRLIS